MRRLAPDRLEVLMEDAAHALAMVLTHDDTTLVRVDARWLRYPMSSCTGAAAFKSSLAGCPLTDDLQALGLYADARAHCTHMHDTCRLGIVHIARGRHDRRYDVVLPATLEGPQPVELLVDGEVALAIEIDMATMTVLAPAWLAGAPLMRGLASWARDRLSADMYEQLVMMQRGTFVSRGRRIDMSRYYGAPAPAPLLGPPEASCFASQPEVYHTATRVSGSIPDLTLDQALHFRFAADA